MNKEEVVKFMEGLDNLNIFLSEKQYRQFHQFFDLLREWNEVMNLTAITDGIEVVPPSPIPRGLWSSILSTA